MKMPFVQQLLISFYRGQIFQINKIDGLVNPPLFHLVDLMKDKVQGAFYSQQLKLAPDPNHEDYWDIEKVLKTKIEKGKKLHYVKFRFYPGKFFEYFKNFY